MPPTDAIREVAVGYTTSREHLAELAELVELLLERLARIRAHVPETAVTPVHPSRHVGAEREKLAPIEAKIGALRERIQKRAQHATQFGVTLPLAALAARFSLSKLDAEIVAIAASLEGGQSFNPHLSGRDSAQVDVAFYIALLDGLGDPAGEAVRLRFSPDAPLVRHALVEIGAGPFGRDAPLSQRRVRLSGRVLDYLDGQTQPPPSVLGYAGKFAAKPAAGGALVLEDPARVDQAARALSLPEPLLFVRGEPGVGRKSLVGAAARALGRPMLSVSLGELSGDPEGAQRALVELVREARLQNAVLVIDETRAGETRAGAEGEGASRLPSQLGELLRRAEVPVAVVADKPPPWLPAVGRLVTEIEVPFPTEEAQKRLWIRHLPPSLRLADISLDDVVHRYALSCAAIGEAAADLARLDAVAGRGGVVGEDDLVFVIRRRLAHRLGSLASLVQTTLDWDDVILPDDVLGPVFEFLNYAAQRRRVLDEWGFRRKLPYGRGLSALFSGPPGTGKTMICSLLAKELGLDLYRIDLSQVVNKYIGETEKNLGRVFDEAARGQVMLLFDEADSLFAKRTEVKSSHDRYANLEVNYLLQRMEAHEGVVVMTTNAETSIDQAFRRRIRFRIRFPAPDEEHRVRLWRELMPREARVAADIDYKFLANKFPMSGGNIMNALVRAATAAAADGSVIEQRHLVSAAEREYSEMGYLA